jgi:DNA repair exonuclease SbcCD ATPase subunit
MIVTFEHVRYKNVFSSGNQFIEVPLSEVGSTLILGANGQGKSTLLDALCFGLFKRPFRKISKLSMLVNTVNNADLVVEIKFRVGTYQFLVRRGLKPAIFEIYQNGKLIDQDAKVDDYQQRLEKILGFTYESFKQVCILGNASYVPFMQLKTAERREFIEQLLDIQVFSRMNEVLKERVSTLKKDLSDAVSRIVATVEQVQLVEGFIAKLDSDQKKEADECQWAITQEREQIDIENKKISELIRQITILDQSVSDQDEINSNFAEFCARRMEAKSRIQSVTEQATFYEQTNTCKQCRQEIGHDHKCEILAELAEKRQKYEAAVKKLDQRIEACRLRLDEIQAVSDEREKFDADVISLRSSIRSHQQYIRILEQRLEKQTGSVDEEREKLAKLNARLAKLEAQRNALIDNKDILDLTTSLLKDSGIKASIIRQYVPIITRMANRYLATMEFFVSFSLDENFEEAFKARHRDTLSYFSFSEGEKKRIDLALLFTMREVARLKNSVATNILILDEVLDSSLDEAGMDNVLRMIRDSSVQTNVFVISHRGHSLMDKFDSVITFKKEGLFSKMETVAA